MINLRFKKTLIRGLPKKIRNNKEQQLSVRTTGKSVYPGYSKNVIKIHDRDNRGYGVMRSNCANGGYLLLDSTYTQAGNPSSMRNLGFPKNIIYNFTPAPLTKEQKKVNANAGITGDSEMTSDWSRNSNNRAKTALLTQTQPYPYHDFYTITKNEDCTKNISDNLFSPGLTVVAMKTPKKESTKMLQEQSPYYSPEEEKKNKRMQTP